MPHLIVLSNRVKSPHTAQHHAGGLAVALQNALSEQGGRWLGWNGKVHDTTDSPLTNTACQVPTEQVTVGNIEYVTTAYTAHQYRHFYCGFANNVLWPAMHGRVDLVTTDSEDYAVYQAVNEQFARQLHAMATPDTLIWVHDYHFLSVAHYCRQLGMNNRIGFFLHIPFAPLASWQSLSEIAHSEALMAHLACYDVVGLQTPADQQHCVTALTRLTPLTVVSDVLPSATTARPCASELRHPDGRTLQVNCYPIGVNVALIQHTIAVAQSSPPATPLPAAFVNKPSAQASIIAVDRVDYAKGLPERFAAFAEFLRRYPAFQKNVQLRQIACPCRLDIAAYRDLNAQIHAQVHAINAELCQPDWQPIVCCDEALPHEALMPVLRHSDICWVNSLKDGMNLVAKEYIAAQSPDNPGVLILSKYAGAAEQMPDAVIVDPLEPESLITGLHTALTMPLAERQARYQALIKGLERDSIRVWRETFLQDLAKFNDCQDLVTKSC